MFIQANPFVICYAGVDINALGFVSQALPQRTSVDKSQSSGERWSPYNERFVNSPFNDNTLLSDEGAYFVTNDGTANWGTGIAFGGAAITAFNDTTGAGLSIYNKDKVKRISVKSLKIWVRTIATGTLAAPWQTFAFKLDSLSNRYASGGTQFTPQNTRFDGSGTIADVRFGALTLTAASGAAKLLYLEQPRTSNTQVANDAWNFTFGGIERFGQNFAPAATSAITWITVPLGPITIGPGETLTVHQYCGGQTAAPVCDFQLEHLER